MTRWDYLYVSATGEVLSYEELNELDEEGWEVVGFAPISHNTWTYLLKRPKRVSRRMKEQVAKARSRGPRPEKKALEMAKCAARLDDQEGLGELSVETAEVTPLPGGLLLYRPLEEG